MHEKGKSNRRHQMELTHTAVEYVQVGADNTAENDDATSFHHLKLKEKEKVRVRSGRRHIHIRIRESFSRFLGTLDDRPAA